MLAEAQLCDAHVFQVLCVAVRYSCSVSQCVAVCCSVLQCVAVPCIMGQCGAVWCNMVQRVAVCCSVLQCVAVPCIMLQFVVACVAVSRVECNAILDLT